MANLRKASTRDRQLEAWTKVPEDVAAAIEAWAKEQKCSVYEMVRRLIYVGMLTGVHAAEWHEEENQVEYMSRGLKKRVERLVKRELEGAATWGKRIQAPEES